ncbi:MAG: hypothetical protein KatS3mg087_0252 [Patescibacteria group bacterium]|nr:MAG: hypothetical protein KatS3mg087_0252 [Patescibacteria group bacterium]
MLALRRLVLLPVYLFSRAVGQSAPGVYRVTGAVSDSGVGLLAAGAVWLCSLLMAIAGGGLGLWIFKLGWVWYWQQREYAADAYATKLGQGGNLERFLDERLGGTLTSFDIAAPYLLIEPPSTELRIDRLKYPENYESADTFDARPMLTVLAVVVAVFWLFPMTTSAFSRMAYDVSGSWHLTSFCRVQGCEPSEPYNDVPVEVYFDDGMVDAQVVQGTFVYQRSGTYTYIASDRVLLSTRSVTAFPLTFNGDYRIKRTGNTLILYGGGESLKFERQ